MEYCEQSSTCKAFFSGLVVQGLIIWTFKEQEKLYVLMALAI